MFLKYNKGRYQLQFTGRKTRKANLYYAGHPKPLGVVPVTWTDMYQRSSGTIWLYFRSGLEQAQMARKTAYYYAAVAHNVPGVHNPRKFDREAGFAAIIYVRSTGLRDPAHNRIQAEVIGFVEGWI